jgi:hypothetical protein
MDNPPLRFGIAPPNWGVFGNPHHAAELASVAERAGWHGYFTWDGLPVKDNPPPIYDPWVILASVAAATELIRIGTCVAVVPRYKPHLLAMRVLQLLPGGEGFRSAVSDAVEAVRMPMASRSCSRFDVRSGCSVGSVDVATGGQIELAELDKERLVRPAHPYASRSS